MSMRAVEPASAVPEQFGRRMTYRFPVTLPAYVELSGRKFSARLINLGRSGALIETSGALAIDAAIVFRCGTVAAAAVTVWTQGNRFGISFAAPLTPGQIQEQLSRSVALGSRPSEICA